MDDLFFKWFFDSLPQNDTMAELNFAKSLSIEKENMKLN